MDRIGRDCRDRTDDIHLHPRATTTMPPLAFRVSWQIEPSVWQARFAADSPLDSNPRSRHGASQCRHHRPSDPLRHTRALPAVMRHRRIWPRARDLPRESLSAVTRTVAELTRFRQRASTKRPEPGRCLGPRRYPTASPSQASSWASSSAPVASFR
jgi:hypothetical protein